MRDIKFRAWDIESPTMLTWEEIQDQWESEGYHPAILSNDHYHCMQFTGIHDKDGKEIYEGDIYNVFQSGAVVSRNNVVELADFLGGHYWVTHHGIIPAYEIIGNIHQNPELLEELS